jgi:hypothetical protein
MALSDQQRIAIMAAAIRDVQAGKPRFFPSLIQSPQDIERLLAKTGLPFSVLFRAARQAAQEIEALGDKATPEQRAAIISEAYSQAAASAAQREDPASGSDNNCNNPL